MSRDLRPAWRCRVSRRGRITWLLSVTVGLLLVGGWAWFQHCGGRWSCADSDDALRLAGRTVAVLSGGSGELSTPAPPSELRPYAQLPQVRGLVDRSLLLSDGRLLLLKDARRAVFSEAKPSPVVVAVVPSLSDPEGHDLLRSDGRLALAQRIDPATGQPLDGTTSKFWEPSAAAGAGEASLPALVAGGTLRLWLQADGRVWQYRAAPSGQVSPTAPVAGLSGVVGIAAGHRHGLAWTADGRVWQWDADAAAFQAAPPEPVQGLQNIVQVVAGQRHSAALDRDGRVWTWGDPSGNRLGVTGLGRSSWVSEPVEVPGLSQVTALAAGPDHTLALRRDGSVWGWGMNGSGQLGVAPTGWPSKTETHPRPPRLGEEPPRPLAGARDIQRIFTSEHLSVLLDQQGQLFLIGHGL